MESRVIKVRRNNGKEYPYFATDGTHIWLVKSKLADRRGYVHVAFVDGNGGYYPFEYECDMRLSKLTKVDRMKLTFVIGNPLVDA